MRFPRAALRVDWAATLQANAHSMLQKLRDKTSGWIAGTVLGLLTIPFAFFGMEQYMHQSNATWVAKVEAPPAWWASAPHWWPASMLWQSEEIGADEFRQRFEQERQSQRQAQGDAFDTRQFEAKDNKRRVVDAMVDERVLKMMAARDGIAIGDTQVRRVIEGIPAFQVDGKFNPQQYQMVLASQSPRRTPTQFQQLLRENLQSTMISDQLVATGFATPAEVDAVLRLIGEKRDVSVAVMPAPSPDAGAVSAADIQRWYDAHSSEYTAPETVALEYVDIDGSAIPVPAATDAALKQRYEQEKARFQEPEQRLASHILVKVDKGATPAVQAAAKARAEAIAAEARAPGADFAALARKDSDDTGSKEAGGDLGWITKGMMVKPFEDALFAMNDGDIVGPVQTEFGWHVLQLREVKAGRQTPFEEARAQLEKEQGDADRDRLFNDLTGKLVDQVYRNPTSLAAAARAANLPVQRTAPFARSVAVGAGGIESNPAVQRAAFSEALVQDGTVSDPIEIGPNHSVLIRVVAHDPEHRQPLSAVASQVIVAIRNDRAAKAAKASAEALVAEVRGGKAFDAAVGARGLVATSMPAMPRGMAIPDPAANQAIFAAPAPAAGKTTVGSKVLADGRIAIYQVRAVVPGDPKESTPAQRQQLQQQLGQAMANESVLQMIRGLRRSMQVNVAEDRM
jgi:peptidyl-prolyl cis-trans isomerase D